MNALVIFVLFLYFGTVYSYTSTTQAYEGGHWVGTTDRDHVGLWEEGTSNETSTEDEYPSGRGGGRRRGRGRGRGGRKWWRTRSPVTADAEGHTPTPSPTESWGRPDWASKDGSNSTDGRGQWGGGRGRYGGDRGFRGGSGGAWNSRMRQLINSNSTLGEKLREYHETMACSSGPCQNGGSCLDYGIIHCICPDGYKGRYCHLTEDQEDPCKDVWCVNHCSYGYEDDTDTHCHTCECRENPCERKECKSTEDCKTESLLCNPSQPACVPVAKCVAKPVCAEFQCRKECEYGYQKDSDGCYHCACASDPCLSTTCDSDRVCKLQKIPCMPMQEKCMNEVYPVCRARKKTGTCPNSAMNNIRNSGDTSDRNSVSTRQRQYKSSSRVTNRNRGSRRGSRSRSCKRLCKSDEECVGLKKCCSNGCGTQCVLPDFTDSSRCWMEVEEAKVNNITAYVPWCDSDGLYDTIQCTNTNEGIVSGGQTVCFCVDVYTGTPLRGTYGYNRNNVSCEDVTTHPCPMKKCLKTCVYGHKADSKGCDTCACKPSPCQDHQCAPPLTCQLMEMPCKREPCYPEPVCVDISLKNVSCPYGDVLMEDDEPLKCSVHRPTPRSNSRSRGKMPARQPSPCPSTYHCRKVATLNVGVCCPIKQSTTKMCFTRHERYSLISKAITRPMTEHRPHSFYFGNTFSTAKECEQACEGEPACHVFTYIEQGYWSKVWKGQCYGLGSGVPVSNTYQSKTISGTLTQCVLKPGFCPTPHRLPGACVDHCDQDSSCPGDMKCCDTKCGSICARAEPNYNSTCHEYLEDVYMALQVKPLISTFIPRCYLNGTWQEVQCHDAFGVCWCSDEGGNRIPGTQVRGTPQCDQYSLQQSTGRSDQPICPATSVLHQCMPGLCLESLCTSDPTAVCRINPCDGCKAEFYDNRNQIVDCTVFHGFHSKCLTDYAVRIQLSATILRTNRLHLLTSEMDDLSEQVEKIYHMASGREMAYGKKKMSLDSDGLRTIKKMYQDMYRYYDTRNVCPKVKTASHYGACVSDCSDDRDCGLGRMCCYNGCGQSCMYPDRNDEKCLQPQFSDTDAAELCGPEMQEGPSPYGGHGGKYSRSRSRGRYSRAVADDRRRGMNWHSIEAMTRKQSFWTFNMDARECVAIDVKCYVGYYQRTMYNLFKSRHDCEKSCTDTYPFMGIYIPQCALKKTYGVDANVNFLNKQCHDGVCWCVNAQGEITNGTMTLGLLHCDTDGYVQASSDYQSVCPDGSIPRPCPDSCVNAKCFNSTLAQDYGDVHCFADPCKNCEVSFYDAGRNDKVLCLDVDEMCSLPADVGPCRMSKLRWHYDANLQTCKKFTYGGCQGNGNNFETKDKCVLACGGSLCANSASVQVCEDVCGDAVCEHFPEAICLPDPCSCVPVFYDPESGVPVHCNVDRSLCERMRAEAERIRLLGDSNSTQIHSAQCRQDGTFNPLQCSETENVCWCVDQEGVELANTRKQLDEYTPIPECHEQQTLAVNFQFTFDESFSTISHDIVGFALTAKKALADKIDVPAEYIVDETASPGSIIFQCQLLQQSDSTIDLPSLVDVIKQIVYDDAFIVKFEGYQYVASSSDMQSDYILDDNRLSPAAHMNQGFPQSGETVGEYSIVAPKDNKVYYIAAVIGVIAVAVIAFGVLMIVRQGCRRPRHEESVSFSNMMSADSTAATPAVDSPVSLGSSVSLGLADVPTEPSKA